jgi:Negative regulator of beta-lactamase expression
VEIRAHRLSGNGIFYQDTPNKDGELVPRYLVFHYTAGRSAQSSIDFLCNPEAKASAHVVLGRDGGITQLAPFNIKTWHAGVSQWNGLSGLNSYSIGVEMDNAGPLKKVGSRYVAWFGGEYPDDQVFLGRHKHETSERYWHIYTEVQIAKALELAGLLVKKYQLEDVLGHEDIAKGRKTDPGPAFPLESMRSRVIGRADDEPAHYRVTATTLNIRSGPGIEFDKTAPPLKKGTEVVLLEAGGRWSRVEVAGPRDIEGWVNNQYIVRIITES